MNTALQNAINRLEGIKEVLPEDAMHYLTFAIEIVKDELGTEQAQITKAYTTGVNDAQAGAGQFLANGYYNNEFNK